MKNLNKQLLLLFIALGFTISACGLMGKRYEQLNGRIMHEIHDKPLSHTVVVALWKGTETKNNTDKQVCYHVESTTSDDKGYFYIPEWREPGSFRHLKNKAVHVYAFHKHYRTSELTSRLITPKNYIYYLAKPRLINDETKAREARLRYLQQILGKTTCDLKGPSRANLEPLYKKIIEEAEDIAVTPKDRKIVEKLKGWLAFIKVEEN